MVVIKHLNMIQLGAYPPSLPAHVQMFTDDISVNSPRYFLSDDLTDLASPEETLHPFVVVDHPGLTAHVFLIWQTRSQKTSRRAGKMSSLEPFSEKRWEKSPPPPTLFPIGGIQRKT